MRNPKRRTTEKLTVFCPPDVLMLSPEDWKRWILLPAFENKWRALGLGDDDLRALQIMVMLDPKRHAVMSGTGGLRKLRFAKKGAGMGKSGAYRVGYAYFEEFGVIAAIAVFAKKDQDNINAGQRAEIRKLIAKLEKWVEDGG